MGRPVVACLERFSVVPDIRARQAQEEIHDLVAWLATKNEKVPAAPDVLDPETLLKK